MICCLRNPTVVSESLVTLISEVSRCSIHVYQLYIFSLLKIVSLWMVMHIDMFNSLKIVRISVVH